jgi:glycosyltransferase involved in cell wall biosynthesis
VLYWGNFLPHHGVDTMIEAATALPETEFMFLGDSEHRPAVIQQAESLGATNIELPGFVSFPALVWAITEADVILGPMGDNPQTEFTVGTKVAEAAYLQKAIAVADQPGIGEVFVDRTDASLVSPGSTDGLVEAIEEILSDEVLKTASNAGPTRLISPQQSPSTDSSLLPGLSSDRF